jgi:hypothetical protein
VCRSQPERVIRASTEKTINGEDAGGGGKTPKLAQDTAMHEHLQKPVDPRKLASSKVHTVSMPLLAHP